MVKLDISGQDGSAVIAFYLIIIVSRSKLYWNFKIFWVV